MAVARADLSLDEFLLLPEEKPALEFINGVVTQKESPKLKHSALQGSLLRLLHEASLSDHGARAFPNYA